MKEIKEKMKISSIVQEPSVRVKMLLTIGAIAGPLFVVTFLIEGLTRANYNPFRHPVSSLALGEYGWLQSANFIVAGLLTLAFSIGLRLALRPQKGSTWGPLLIAIWAIGLLGAGIFITDPVSGYPPGTLAIVQNPTVHGALHDQLSLLGFLALLGACLVFGFQFASQSERGWATYSVVSGILFAAGVVLASAAFGQNESLVAFGGLLQRVAVTVGFAWQTLLAVHLLRPLVYEQKPIFSF
jgi:hypothetical protein